MVQLTDKAIGKVREIMASQEPAPAGLRIAVVGGGCSGFSYSMAFENQPNMLDKTYDYNGLKVFVDQASLLYLDGAEVAAQIESDWALHGVPIVFVTGLVTRDEARNGQRIDGHRVVSKPVSSFDLLGAVEESLPCRAAA